MPRLAVKRAVKRVYAFVATLLSIAGLSLWSFIGVERSTHVVSFYLRRVARVVIFSVPCTTFFQAIRQSFISSS